MEIFLAVFAGMTSGITDWKLAWWRWKRRITGRGGDHLRCLFLHVLILH